MNIVTFDGLWLRYSSSKSVDGGPRPLDYRGGKGRAVGSARVDGRRKSASRTNEPSRPPRSIGYARVSTADQNTDTQCDLLLAQGCELVFTDVASGGTRERPGLKDALNALRPGDTLLFTRLDRIARSLTNLLEIASSVQDRGADFRALNDHFDISSSQGRLMMQMLGSFAEFERAIIKERTRAGMAAAKGRGAKIGNPAFHSRDPVQLALMRAQRADTILQRSRDTLRPHLRLIRQLRPATPWKTVLAQINATRPENDRLHMTTFKAHLRRLARAGEIEAAVSGRAMGESADAALAVARERLLRDKQASFHDVATILNEEGLKPARANQWTADRLRRALKRTGFSVRSERMHVKLNDHPA